MLVSGLETSHKKACLRPSGVDETRCPNQRGEIEFQLLIARARQETDYSSGTRLLYGQELVVQFLSGQLIEVRMTDVMSGDAPALIPRLFKRQPAEYVINPSTHFLHAPAAPCPKLGRHKIENRNAVEVSAAGQPPMKPGVIDQDHRVRPLMSKIAIGSGKKLKEQGCAGKDPREPHHRQLTEWIKQPASRRCHFLPAKSDAVDFRTKVAKDPDQIGPVQVAAGLAGGDKDVHRHPCLVVQKSEVRSQRSEVRDTPTNF